MNVEGGILAGPLDEFGFILWSSFLQQVWGSYRAATLRHPSITWQAWATGQFDVHTMGRIVAPQRHSYSNLCEYSKRDHAVWLSAQLLSHVWLWDPMDCSPPGSLLSREILQARILKWVAMPSSRGSSHPRDQTLVSCIAGRFFTVWGTREAQEYWSGYPIPSPGYLPDPGIKRVSCIAGDSLPAELPGKPTYYVYAMDILCYWWFSQ